MKNLTVSNQYAFEVNATPITVKPHESLGQGFADDDFQRIMLEAVDETFSSLGKRTKQSIYSQLEKTLGTSRKNIPVEIEKFTSGLEKIFGPEAQLLEIEIMKHLYKKIGSKFKYCPKQKNLIFIEYLETTHAFLSTNASEKKPMPNEYYDYKFC